MKIPFNRRSLNLCRLLLAVAVCVFFQAGLAYASPAEETVRILENSTSFHWGRDCFVWIVHYPEELVDPWVDSEAGRVGMTESERESFKNSFMSDLSVGELEPFLFTVYAFGARALSFSPISDQVELVTADGARLKPVRYDRVLDGSIRGLVQGFIFFPKQDERDFAIAVRGMGIHDERIFAFSDSGGDQFLSDDPANEDGEADEDGVVVVVIPPAPNPPAPKPTPPPKPRDPAPQAPAPQVAARQASLPPSQPSLPPSPSSPPGPGPEIVVIEPETETEQSMADFVEEMRRGNRARNDAGQDGGSENGEAGEAEPGQQAQAQQIQQEQQNDDSSYVSREKTLRTFLDMWVKSDAAGMYAMLSEASRGLFSQQDFAAELGKSSDFRTALRDGYTVDWLDTDRAKIVAVRRILLIRTLLNRTLGVAREDSEWKIVW